MDEVWHDRARRQYLLAVDDDHALRHEPSAERHHEWLNAQQSDTHAIDRSHHQAEAKSNRDRRWIAELQRCGRHEERRTHRDADDGQIDSAGQHHHGLTRGKNTERGREQERVRQPNGIDRARFQKFDRRDENEEQQDQSNNRVPLKPEKNAAGLQAPRPRRRIRRTAHLRFLTRVASPPAITTRTINVPWMTWPKFGSMFRKIRSAGMRVSTKAAMTGPTIPPRPPVRLTPPMTTAANPLSV